MSVWSVWMCVFSVCLAAEPGLSAGPPETDGVRVGPVHAGRPAHAGGPAPETAPPGGGGETALPQRGGAHHTAAPVSNTRTHTHGAYMRVHTHNHMYTPTRMQLDYGKWRLLCFAV